MGSHPVPYRHHATPDRRNHWIEPTRRDLEPAPSDNLPYERGVQWGVATRHRDITDREAHSWGPNPPDPLHVHHTHRLVGFSVPPAFYAAMVALILVLAGATVASLIVEPGWLGPGRVFIILALALFGTLLGVVGFFASASTQERQHRHGHRS